MTTLNRFQNELSQTSADAAIISSQINIRYLCGFDYTDGFLLILPSKAYLITDFRYIEAAKKSVREFEVVMPDSDMLSELSLLMTLNGVKTVSIEDRDVSCATFSEWSQKFNGITIASGASEILKQQRMVKTDEELELINLSQQITDKAFEHILGFISTDRTELEVALELEFFMRSQGAESVAFDTIVASGSNSSLPHCVPSNKKLSHGFLTMDFGAKYKGYCSDMTRTVVIGKATDDMKKVYSTVLRAQNAALEQIHEGIDCREADKISRDIIFEAGFGNCFGHSLGHGVGLYIHESPSMSPRAQTGVSLTRGNVVTVEPGIYIEGKNGCRIEDMIAIGHDGKIINFTKSPKELIEI